MEIKNLKEFKPREQELLQLELIRCSFISGQTEEWIQLPLEGKYFISSFGRVKRITPKHSRGRILSPTFNKGGFWHTLRDEKNFCFGRRVDRLMGWWFGYEYFNIRKVIHLNGNRHCNYLKNLEFVLWK